MSAGEGADVLARFDNGDPALISVEMGKGRVLLFTSSADDSGNDLPLKAVYAPLWQQLLRYLEKFREDRLWYQVGDAIDPGKAPRRGRAEHRPDEFRCRRVGGNGGSRKTAGGPWTRLPMS